MTRRQMPRWPDRQVVRLAGDLPADLAMLAGVRTITKGGDRAGAARIEDLQVGEVLARGGQLVSLDEFMTSARDVDVGRH